MTDETYNALASCARRRIEREWACTAAERGVLGLVLELSLELGQTWAFVPCLADFAAVLGVHKSTVCRALRSALKKGFLLVLKRREETLYCLCTETPGNAAPGAADEGKAAETRARLVKLNETRLQGRADPDGQQRLTGVLPNEERAAAARAFEAMMEAPGELAEAAEEPLQETRGVPRETSAPPATPVNAGDDESDAEFQRRLEAMVKAAERRRGESAGLPMPPPLRVSVPLPASVPGPGAANHADAPAAARSRTDAANLDREMMKLCRNLTQGQRHVMERLREEMASAGKIQEAAFFKWGFRWKRDVLKHPAECLEAAGEHKNMRLTTGETAAEPGAWIYRAMKDLIGNLST